MEMKTGRFLAGLTLLWRLGTGDQEPPRLFPESLSSGWMIPNSKRGCPLMGTPTVLLGKRERERLKHQTPKPTCQFHSSDSSQQPPPTFCRLGHGVFLHHAKLALESLSVILHFSCLSDCFHFQLRMQSI